MRVKDFPTFGFKRNPDGRTIGIVDGIRLDHPEVLIEKRSCMKILLLDPEKDVPVKKINTVLKKVLNLYK